MNTNLATMIDHTLLKPNVTDNEILQLCEEAKLYGFASVCIQPCYVSMAHKILKDTDVKVCTVIGFPLGANSTETKIFEANQALDNCSNELDYVINISDVINGRYDAVKSEMEQFIQLRLDRGTFIKIILETCYLSEEQIVKVCKLAKETGLDFVKTSTGFGKGGATLEHIRLMRGTVGPDLGVKASGGIRSYDDTMAMVKAGATRIGTSAGIAIVSKAMPDQQTGY